MAASGRSERKRMIFFGQSVAEFKKISTFAPGFAPQRTDLDRFFEKDGKVEKNSLNICAINFLYLILQSKTVDSADVAQLVRAADL